MSTRPATSNTRQRLARVSRILQNVSRIGMWLWPALTIGGWLILEHLPKAQLQTLAGGPDLGIGSSMICDPAMEFTITWKVKFVGMVVSLVPATLQFLFMRQWVALFGLYREGRIFATENVRCFARMGRLLLGLSIFDILLSTPIHSLVLTLDNPPGKHLLSFGLSSDHVPTFAAGIAMVVIAWVMEEGCKLRSEADLVV
ncbi:MAG TPA: DUF2975 domain-containing protein [Fibrobacteria bacterium]|nr:DUF2975 domain-containing protein [Fibrobacteria bacterium]